MSTMTMKVLSVSLLAALSCANTVWAASATATPNSTTTTTHVDLKFDGACFQQAFDARYSQAWWYSSYAFANTNANIWSYLSTAFRGDVALTTTRHGNNGAVYQVDLKSILSGGSFTYGASMLGANSYTFAAAGDWWTGGSSVAVAGSYGQLYSGGGSASNATSETTMYTSGSNITEFKARVALNAGQFSNIQSGAVANAWSAASTYAGWSSSSSYASAYSAAWAELLSQSVVYLDVTAHYKKKPGTNDLQIVIDKATGYLSCGGYGYPYASTYSYAY